MKAVQGHHEKDLRNRVFFRGVDLRTLEPREERAEVAEQSRAQECISIMTLWRRR